MKRIQICIAIYISIIAAVNKITLTSADIFDECDGMPDETFVASNDDCQAYIYCQGDESQSGICEDGEYFDSESMSCDLATNVICHLDAIEEGPEPEPEPEPAPEPEPEPQPTVGVTATVATTTATAIVVASTFDPLDIAPVIRITCPATDDPSQIVLMANTQSCSDYYLCYHEQAIEMHCTNHLHFNTNTGKCDFPENVQCVLDRPNANKCLPHVTDFFPHPEKCNYFYYCIKGFLTVQQCPFYYGWDVERRSCVQISQAKCFNNAKRM